MQVEIEQKPKTYVVLNPVAGVSEPGNVRERIETALQSHEFPLEIYETTGGKDENIRQVVRDAVKRGFRLFISAGGDGTLSSVIDGFAFGAPEITPFYTPFAQFPGTVPQAERARLTEARQAEARRQRWI